MLRSNGDGEVGEQSGERLILLDSEIAALDFSGSPVLRIYLPTQGTWV